MDEQYGWYCIDKHLSYYFKEKPIVGDRIKASNIITINPEHKNPLQGDYCICSICGLPLRNSFKYIREILEWDE